jgi:hypothetical protein
MTPLMSHLAKRLADRQAVSTIIDECAVVVIQGTIWRDTEKLRTLPHVVWECKYLHMRGMLARHPQNQRLVKLRGFEHEKTV